MYSAEARARRRCLGVRKDGQPCRAWAKWGDPRQLCAAHSGIPRRPVNRRERWRDERTRAEACRCEAYRWPHRPGGGWCRWPDPPLVRVSIPAGTHRISSGGHRRTLARSRRIFG